MKALKTRIALLVLIFLSFGFVAYGEEAMNWPGEGIPVISFKDQSYLFCKTPKLSDSCGKKSVMAHKKYALTGGKTILGSQYFTVKPVEMVAKQNFMIDEEVKLKIEKGQKIIKKQSVGEGFYEVEIDGKPYQITLDNYAEFLDHADEKPMTEWWINVSGSGWLLLTEDNVIYHDRQF